METNGSGMQYYTDGVRLGAGLVEQAWAVDWVRALVRMDRSYAGIRQAFATGPVERTPADLFAEMKGHLTAGRRHDPIRHDEFWQAAVGLAYRPHDLGHDFLQGFCEGAIGAALSSQMGRASRMVELRGIEPLTS